MAPSETKVYSSFGEKLPNLHNVQPPYQDASQSSSTTGQTEPPKYVILYDISASLNLAEKLLSDCKQHDRLQGRMPEKEKPFPLLTEGDVIRAANLYLLHPVNQAINASYHKRVICLSEARMGPIRADIKWVAEVQPGILRTIAVLELKRRGTLRREDFDSALVQDTPAYRHQKMMQALDMRDQTTFRDNAIKLVKQASAYAIAERTRFVALFDWDSLYLIDFNELRVNHDGTGYVGDFARGVFVNEQTGLTHRKALLGFLSKACDKHQL